MAAPGTFPKSIGDTVSSLDLNKLNTDLSNLTILVNNQSFAPLPTNAAGVIGSFQYFNNGVLPAGGIWVYYVMRIGDDGNVTAATATAGYAGGGTTVSAGGTGGSGGGQGGNYGWCWRIL